MTDAQTFTIDLETKTNRKCGDCTLCCKLLPVRELDKPANTRCQFQFSKGCRVYHKAPQFPRSCAIWSCRWLVNADTAALRRPDRSGYVIDNLPDIIRLTDKVTGAVQEHFAHQVWVDPARPEAWRDPALLRWADDQAREHGMMMIIRFGSRRAIAAVAPALSPDGEWHFVDDARILPSRTGSMLLDRMSGSPQ